MGDTGRCNEFHANGLKEWKLLQVYNVDCYRISQRVRVRAATYIHARIHRLGEGAATEEIQEASGD